MNKKVGENENGQKSVICVMISMLGGLSGRPFLYQHAVAVVNFMLDDLSCPACKGLDTKLEIRGLPTDFDGLPAFAGTGTAEKRQTTFLCIVGR